MHRQLTAAVSTLLLWLTLVPALAAQEGRPPPAVKDITRLGGTTALYAPPLTTVADLKRMGGNARVVANLRTVLGQAGTPALADSVVATLANATSAVRGSLCSEATPEDGVIVECAVQPGQRMAWMAFRPHGDARLDVMRDIRWAGRMPFAAYLFRTTADGRIYTFIVPKACGNLTLFDERDAPRVAVSMPPTPPPTSVTLSAPPPAPPPPAAPPVALTQLEPAPLLALAQPPRPAAARRPAFFVDALVGKDRRVRPIGDRTTIDGERVTSNAGTAGTDFAQCSPLFGALFGAARRFENNWEVAGAAGLAVSLVNTGTKVRHHALLVDVEANRYLSGGTFVGTGLSLWDITHRDTFTPAWLFHVGVPLVAHRRHPLSLLLEGRLFFDHFGDVANNYQFWGGVRLHI